MDDNPELIRILWHFEQVVRYYKKDSELIVLNRIVVGPFAKENWRIFFRLYTEDRAFETVALHIYCFLYRRSIDSNFMHLWDDTGL